MKANDENLSPQGRKRKQRLQRSREKWGQTGRIKARRSKWKKVSRKEEMAKGVMCCQDVPVGRRKTSFRLSSNEVIGEFSKSGFVVLVKTKEVSKEVTRVSEGRSSFKMKSGLEGRRYAQGRVELAHSWLPGGGTPFLLHRNGERALCQAPWWLQDGQTSTEKEC